LKSYFKGFIIVLAFIVLLTGCSWDQAVINHNSNGIINAEISSMTISTIDSSGSIGQGINLLDEESQILIKNSVNTSKKVISKLKKASADYVINITLDDEGQSEMEFLVFKETNTYAFYSRNDEERHFRMSLSYSNRLKSKIFKLFERTAKDKLNAESLEKLIIYKDGKATEVQRGSSLYNCVIDCAGGRINEPLTALDYQYESCNLHTILKAAEGAPVIEFIYSKEIKFNTLVYVQKAVYNRKNKGSVEYIISAETPSLLHDRIVMPLGGSLGNALIIGRENDYFQAHLIREPEKMLKLIEDLL
jgi:hypothetical protein